MVAEKQAALLLVRSPRPGDGSTPVFAAAARGFASVVEYLASMGADLGFPRKDGATPFYMACLMGHLHVAVFLATSLGPAVLRDSTRENATPLLAAVSRGRQDVVAFLVDLARATLEPQPFARFLSARTSGGHTAVQLARRRGQSKLAAFLEWNLSEPGADAVHDRGSGLHTKDSAGASGSFKRHNNGAPPSRSKDACGLQVKVQNGGRWAHDCDSLGLPGVPISDYGFSLDTTIHRGWQASGSRLDRKPGFEDIGPKQKPRSRGGCCTTYNVYECLNEEINGEPKAWPAEVTADFFQSHQGGPFRGTPTSSSGISSSGAGGGGGGGGQVFFSVAATNPYSSANSSSGGSSSRRRGRVLQGGKENEDTSGLTPRRRHDEGEGDNEEEEVGDEFGSPPRAGGGGGGGGGVGGGGRFIAAAGGAGGAGGAARDARGTGCGGRLFTIASSDMSVDPDASFDPHPSNPRREPAEPPGTFSGNVGISGSCGGTPTGAAAAAASFGGGYFRSGSFSGSCGGTPTGAAAAAASFGGGGCFHASGVGSSSSSFSVQDELYLSRKLPTAKAKARFDEAQSLLKEREYEAAASAFLAASDLYQLVIVASANFSGGGEGSGEGWGSSSSSSSSSSVGVGLGGGGGTFCFATATSSSETAASATGREGGGGGGSKASTAPAGGGRPQLLSVPSFDRNKQVLSSLFDKKMDHKKAKQAAAAARREALAQQRVCRKMASHCRAAAGLDADESVWDLEDRVAGGVSGRE